VTDIDDGYDRYYAERLWQLLPALYRTTDTDQYGAPGPLRELVNRIGAQVAVTRRSIDRMWADQSVETCDDWVVPYIGDLLAVSLVPGLDPPGTRADVGKTIHYRRRKGTVAILEEIATDVTGWQARAVEAFRLLARSVHGLDPAIGLPPAAASGTAGSGAVPADPRLIQGLVGPLTGTPAGGLADLRSAHGAALAGTAFCEYSRTADVRAGHGSTGWYGLPKLLVFLWRLSSYAVTDGTPVAVAGCPGQYVFDPTGRDVPLFLAPRPPVDDVDGWVPAREWEIPGPLTGSLLRALHDPGGTAPARAKYPAEVTPSYSVAVIPAGGGTPDPVADAGLTVWPELGRFELPPPEPAPPPAAQPQLLVSYSYGGAGPVGAGTYDRELLGDQPAAVGTVVTVTGGSGLDTALAGLTPAAGAPAAATVAVADSRSYPLTAGVTVPVASTLIQAGALQRPVVRLDPGVTLVFSGTGESAELTLDGLLISGGDIVLRGSFGSVTLTGCTLDPGTAAAPAVTGIAGTTGGTAAPAAAFATAADGRTLAPVRLWIEADPAGSATGIGQLTVSNCILGPVRTRAGGILQALTVADSIIQGLRQSTAPPLTAADVFDPYLLARLLVARGDPVSGYLWGELSAGTQAAISTLAAAAPDGQSTAPDALITDLNQVIDGVSIYDPVRFASVSLPPDVAALAAKVEAAGTAAAAADVARLNRMLLEAAYPVPLGTAAMALADTAVGLCRVTALGRLSVHQLTAADSILAGFARAQDPQQGSVRFCAWSSGSVIPQRYTSVQVAERAPLFTSSAFGDPGYGQLLDTADRLIVPEAAQPAAGTPMTSTSGSSVASGAENGSELGAFCSLLNPVRERGLLLKYNEYLPVGLTPVLVHVT
jgi:hypothetical protein